MSGLYKIPMHAESIEKTAFITPDGRYEFSRMSFGLADALSVFQRAMNKTLGALHYGRALVYIDDILIPCSIVKGGFKNLEFVLKALRNHNFTLNLAKCTFSQGRIGYLGWEITAEGIRPGTVKVDAVLKAPISSSQKQVCQFLGSAGYFCKFIPNYAKKLAPLNGLLRKNVSWQWNSEHVKVVEVI